jgi:molecular chaperone HscA
VKSEVTVKPSYGLGDEEITRMLMESFSEAAADKDRRALNEARMEAERMLLALRAALEIDGKLLDEAERSELADAMSALEALAQGTDHLAIHAATENLNTLSEPFAARRMDASVRTVLAGHTLDDFDHA